jgi:tRNA uridine 5-carbamoylmethylation protein Kti12
MFVKVNKVTIKNAEVTQLDIDDYGSVIPLRDLELMIPSNDDSIFHALNGTPYAIIFIDRQEINESEGKRGLATIILANPITIEELNEEKRKIIESINKK